MPPYIPTFKLIAEWCSAAFSIPLPIKPEIK